jgi:hypothetical protein
MMWRLLQIAVFGAVIASNIEYQWTPNGYVAGLLAVFAAFAVTALLGELFRLVGWARQRLRLLLR